MKHIKDLTEQDCIHCATQEEWDAIATLLIGRKFDTQYENGINCIRRGAGITYFCSLVSANYHGYTIHPASDFLTPQVNVLTEIGDCKVIRHNDGCIVIKDDKAMTLSSELINWIKENL
jgi:hypothetical protein